jgi:hypothetical protein
VTQERALVWWMRIVGAFYVAIGVRAIPLINEQQVALVIPGLEVGPQTVAFKALIDWIFLFGVDTLVIGVMLLVGSRRPGRATLLVHTVLVLEAVRGVAFDVYLILRGYAPAPFYVGFIVVHLAIIATGLVALRRAETRATDRGTAG